MKTVTKAYIYDEEGNKIFGPGPYRLLCGIMKTGSLKKSADNMNMSYSKAFAKIKNAEKALGYALTTRSIGGKSGGGSVLTPQALKLMKKYEHIIDKSSKLIIVRGGGDLATGTIIRLFKSGFRVLVLETKAPAAIRRQVSLCEAVFEGETVVEGVHGILAGNVKQINEAFASGKIPIVIDENGDYIKKLKPSVVIDAILAKKNLGTTIDMAGLVIALGPGFEAGVDADYVIETKRGHNLGRIISEGSAIANTGIPGIIGGYGKERVIHAACAGRITNIHAIGDVVKKGEPIAKIINEHNEVNVEASIDGIIRGLIRDGYEVTEGFKIADIDPRLEELSNCFTISDKSRCISGSVLELVCAYERGTL